MFSSTAYEAFYEIIGLHLHEASIKIITSQEVLIGILALTFGCAFFFTTWNYFKRYLPFIGGGGRSGITTIVKLVASFLLGVSILKVSTHTHVNNYNRISWHHNDYIEKKVSNIQEQYEVSFIFDMMTRSSEELARLASVIVDKLFEKGNSELHAPSAFYKAVMYAGSVSIDDPKLRSLIDFYSTECFDKVIPLIESGEAQDKISEFFRPNGVVDRELEKISIKTKNGVLLTCLDLKEKVRLGLFDFARRKGVRLRKYRGRFNIMNPRQERNDLISSGLNNYFLSKSESLLMNIKKGAEVPGGFSSFLLGWKRFWTMDGFFSFFGREDLEGASLTADRALQFNEYLKRAPHIKGMVKLFLIAIFPWLIFLIFVGKWKVLISWWAVYFSVLLWTPIWTLLYHLMTSIALSTEVMEHFGRINDGISLYSSQLITNRLYQFYAIYSWLQVIVGPLPTVILAWGMFTGFLKDSEEGHAPTEGVGTTISVVGATVTGGASGGVGAGLSAGAKTATRYGGYHPSHVKDKSR